MRSTPWRRAWCCSLWPVPPEEAADKPQSSDESIQMAGNAVVRGSRGTITTYIYSCVPDTIDPRGPKGK
jgi:hypothetical protein